MSNSLQENQQLNVNDQLISSNNKAHLIMQNDGNLVLYRNDNDEALWASNTAGTPVNRAVMQGDGNLVCYDQDGRAYWSSGTYEHPGSLVVLQDDGNLVVYSSTGNALWSSGTSQNWDPMTVDTLDAHLGTGEWMRSWASVSSSGLISGHTRTWCTIDLRGFHGSIVPVLLGTDGKAVWPPNPQDAKHQYGVDGAWIGTHDRTDYWSNQVDSGSLAKAEILHCIQFLDPRNMLLADLGIIGRALPDIVAAIAAIVSA
jgi:hypothetical protein